jgi:hypothetical protein
MIKKTSPITRHESAWDRKYRSYSLLTSALDRSGERHALAALFRREKDPRAHWMGGWVGPRAGPDTEA